MSDSILGDNVHLLLLDRDEESVSATDRPVAIRCGALLAALAQVIAAVVSGALVSASSGGSCTGWLATLYRVLPFHVAFSALPGCCYCWVVFKRQRPMFVHVAGGYLFSNTMALCFMTMYYHTHCGETALALAVVPSMVFCAVTYCLLQLGILLKVEALLAVPARLLRGLLMALGILGGAYLVMHTGVVLELFPGWLFYVEAGVMFAIGIVFTFFTWFAVRDILRCREAILRAKIDEAMKDRHRRTLTVHTGVTVMANGTLLLFIFATVRFLLNGFSGAAGWPWINAFSFDNVMNTVCMVSLSGLTSSVCYSGSRGDVISEISGAGEDARAAPEAARIGRDVEMEAVPTQERGGME